MSAVIEHQGPQSTSLLAKVASRYSVEPNKMLETLKATAFKGDVSNAQMMALLIVADQYGLNPWTKEIYAFPDKNNGIVPVVGVDGWSRIINEHPQVASIEFEYADDASYIDCIIDRKDRRKPTRVREYLSECKRETAPWKSHPQRMLRHKALIQCARIAFGYAGIYDQDEAERIIEVSGERLDAPQQDHRPTRGVSGLKERLTKRKEPEQAAPSSAAAPPSAEPPVSGPSLGDVVALLKKGDLDAAADIAQSLTGEDAEAAQDAIREEMAK